MKPIPMAAPSPAPAMALPEWKAWMETLICNVPLLRPTHPREFSEEKLAVPEVVLAMVEAPFGDGPLHRRFC